MNHTNPSLNTGANAPSRSTPPVNFEKYNLENLVGLYDHLGSRGLYKLQEKEYDKLDFVKALLRTEGSLNPEVRDYLYRIERYLQTMSGLDANEQKALKNPEFDDFILRMREEVLAYKTQQDESEGKYVRQVTEPVGAFFGTGFKKGIRGLSELPTAGKVAVGVLGVLGTLWVLNSERLRKWVGRGMLVGGLAWASRAIFGKSLSGLVDAGINKFTDNDITLGLFRYFNLSKEDKVAKQRIALLQEAMQPSDLGKLDFATLVNDVNSNNGEVSSKTLRGLEIDATSKKEAPQQFGSVVIMMQKKFGPESANYKNNPEIKEIWDSAMSSGNKQVNTVFYRLLQHDNESPLALKTAPSGVLPATLGARNTISYNKDDLKNLEQSLPSNLQSNFKTGFNKRLEFLANFQVNSRNWLSIERDSEYSKHFPFVAALANKATETTLARDSKTGVSYGRYNLTVPIDKLNDPSIRIAHMKSALEKFSQALGTNVEGTVEILYGTEGVNKTTGNHEYSISLAFIPKAAQLSGGQVVSDSSYLALERQIDSFQPNYLEMKLFAAFYGLNSANWPQQKLNEAIQRRQPITAKSLKDLIFSVAFRDEIILPNTVKFTPVIAGLNKTLDEQATIDYIRNNTDNDNVLNYVINL